MKSAGDRQMLKVHRPSILIRPRARLLAALIALAILAGAVGLRAFHQPGPDAVWGDPTQDGAPQPEIGSANTHDEALGQGESGGLETARSRGTTHDTGQGSSRGGAHGSGK